MRGLKLLIASVLAVTSCSTAEVYSQDRNISFIQISDPQIGFFDDNKSYTQDSLNLEIAVKHVNRLRPDFVVVTGDMVNSGTSKKQLACFMQVIKKISPDIPVWYVPGNHDIGANAKEERISSYIDTYGYDRFAFKMNDINFIGINSCIIKDGSASQQKDQLKWMKRVMKQDKGGHAATYIFCHHPFFVNSFEEKLSYSNQEKEDRDLYWILFEENNVSAVISGHRHDDATSSHKGITMITCGPVGKPLGNGQSGVGIYTISGKDFNYQFVTLEKLEYIPYITNN